MKSSYKMSNINLRISEVPYLYDQSGRINIIDDKVFRIIENLDVIDHYRDLLNWESLEDLFSIGLVKTCELSNSDTDVMILKHEKIPFILHPSEYSNQMFYNAACMFIKLNQKLYQKGFITHDAHPWNISFDGKKPIFYDFGSIIKKDQVSKGWFDEFYSCFIVPIWLASFSQKTFRFSKDYRREHITGFGIRLFKKGIIQKVIFRKFRKFEKLLEKPELLFQEISNWLENHEPIEVKPQYWSEYYKQGKLDVTKPSSIKQKFVYNILRIEKPLKVLDLASNKGYYAEMASHLGSSVMAFDYEEEIVNFLCNNQSVDNKITSAHIDFNNPTSSLGVGLFWEDSFSRFKSDIVLALGLIHHICITQKVPVYLFCMTCMKYSEKGLILEFVDPEDYHVAQWESNIPNDYSIDKIKEFFYPKFPNCQISELENSNGLKRYFLYFSR